MITLVNGIAEELFFRGALFAAIGVRHPVLISTVIYTLATVAGGNPVLVFAAAVLGAVVGLQRRAGGGVLAPILTHITWSSAMLFVLPPLFADRASDSDLTLDVGVRSLPASAQTRRVVAVLLHVLGAAARWAFSTSARTIISDCRRTIKIMPSVSSETNGRLTFSAKSRMAPITISTNSESDSHAIHR